VLVTVTVSAKTPLYLTLQVKPDISKLVPVKVSVLSSVLTTDVTDGKVLEASVS